MKNTENWTEEDYISAAQKFENCQEYDMALKYYRGALLLNEESQTAKVGEYRAKNELMKNVYYDSKANFKLIEGRLRLVRGMLIFEGKTGLEKEYFINRMENPKIKFGRIMFDYEGKPFEGYNCPTAKKWVSFLNDAIKGKYPELSGKSVNNLEKYIMDNFSLDKFDEAVLYFEELTNCDPDDARTVVSRILC